MWSVKTLPKDSEASAGFWPGVRVRVTLIEVSFGEVMVLVLAALLRLSLFCRNRHAARLPKASHSTHAPGF
jgi:hypothetical protein